MKEKEKELDIERSLARLESIVSDMESGDISLEKSLTLFEEGMSLVKKCQTELKKAEQKVENLISNPKDVSHKMESV